MVAGFDQVDFPAFDCGKYIGDQGGSGNAFVPGTILEAVVGSLRKENGKLLLLGGKYVQGEKFGVLKMREDLAFMADADEHQRGIERYGRERIDGKAVRRAIGRANRCHSHSGGKLSTSMPECFRVHGQWFGLWP